MRKYGHFPAARKIGAGTPKIGSTVSYRGLICNYSKIQMKKIKLSTAKLQLKKEQVSALNNEKMGMINGGEYIEDTNAAFLSIFNCKSKKNDGRICVSKNPDPSPNSLSPDNCWSYDLANTCN